MESKKISFGFMKTKKAEKPVVEEKKDFIECVEEKSIKVVGGDEVKENAPLIIPMKPNTLTTADRLKQIAEKVESALEEPDKVEEPVVPKTTVENETLDQMAVRELLQDAKKEVNLETPMLTVPLPPKPVNEGEKESTLDDYESVPVQEFGLAMLRGMGWAPNNEKSSYKPPQLRPKGLGLGADKVVKGNQKQKSSKDGKDEELAIVKNAYVKITTGKYSGYYGKVLSLDEDNGRVMVDISVKKETVSLSEFMMHPVPKSEYDKESKVINSGSYEEYKKKETMKKSSSTPDKSSRDKGNKEDKYSERDAASSKSVESKHDKEDNPSEYVEKDRSSKNGQDYKDNEERKAKDRDRSQRSRHRRDSADERSSRKKNKKYSSNDSLDSLSDSEQKRYKKKERKRYSSNDSVSSKSDTDKKKKNKKKERKRRDRSASESDHRSKRNKTPDGKRDIDKKRKGKKKKRDRDRSPNYRKHRK